MSITGAIGNGMAKRKFEDISTTELGNQVESLDESPDTAAYSWERRADGYKPTAALVDNRPGARYPSGGPADTTGESRVGDVACEQPLSQAYLAEPHINDGVAPGQHVLQRTDSVGVHTRIGTQPGNMDVPGGQDERKHALHVFLTLLQDAGFELW